MSRNIALHQAFYYGLGILMMKSVSLVMLPVVTFYLTPAEYGSLELLLSISNFATILVGFGLVEALYRFVGLSKNTSDEKHVISNILSLAIIIGIFSLLIGLYISPFLVNNLFSNISLFDMQLVVVMFSVEGCIAIPLAWLRMKENARCFFLLTTGKAAIQAFLSWQLLSAGYGLTAILIAGVVSALLLMSILIALQIRKTGLSFNKKRLTEILLYGSPLVLSGIAAFALIGADRWIIAAISSESELGLYALGKKLASITLILMQPFCMWWNARRFKQLKQDNGEQKVAHFSSLGIALVMCCASVICIFSPLFINIMINSQFSSAIIYIPWLALFYVVKQTTDLINLGSYLGKSTWNVMSIDMVTAVISLGLSYFLSQYFKIPGVIFALIIAQLCRALLFYKSSQKVLTLNYEWKKLILLALLCSSGVFIVFQIDGLLNQSIIAGLFSCILCLFLYVSQLVNFNKFENNKPLEQRVETTGSA